MTLLSSKYIKEAALNSGFTFCGIANNEKMPVARYYFEQAISKGYHDQMGYLERNIDARFSPEILLPECKSIIVALFNYNTGETLHSNFKISKYVFIKDYHVLVKDLLEQLGTQIKKEYPTINFKSTVDSSSISEKNWAVNAGLGHYGKNGLLITPLGSYFFIGLILIDQEVDFYDQPIKSNGCGTCSICMDKCPTQAIVSPFVIDAKKCLSYQTLSNKNPDYDLIMEHPWIYGCDVCQDVCPKNKKSVVNELAVNNSSLFLHFEDKEFENLTKETFSVYFQGSPIQGKNYEKLLQFIKNRQQWKI